MNEKELRAQIRKERKKLERQRKLQAKIEEIEERKRLQRELFELKHQKLVKFAKGVRRTAGAMGKAIQQYQKEQAKKQRCKPVRRISTPTIRKYRPKKKRKRRYYPRRQPEQDDIMDLIYRL